MDNILKQNTAVTIVMGVMVDSTDGNTPETGLSIAQADIRLSKNGGAYVQSNNVAGATHMETGKYSVPLNTTDTATLGKLRVDIHVTGALAVWREFVVVPANAYDTLVLGTDVLTADITQIGGVAQSATDLKDFADDGYDPLTNKIQGVVLADTVTTNTDMRGTDGANTVIPDAAGVTPTVTEIRTEMDNNSIKMAPSQTLADYKANVSALATTAALTTHDGKLDVVDAIVDRIVATTEIKYGLSVNDVSATTTKFISTLTETQNDFWNRAAVLFTSGNNAGQLRRIKDYNGVTKEIVIQTPLDAAPANGDTFIMPAIRAFITPDIEDIVDQTWDALIADHTVVNSFGAKNQKVVPSETTDDYKATGFSIPNEYDTAISALQTDLDNPDQYKANVSDIALEATLTSMKGATFNGTTDSLESIRDRGDDAWLTGAGGSAPTVSEIRIEMDTNSTKMSPSQTLADYKADVSTLATATALSMHDDKLDTINTIVDAILIDTSTTLENHLTDIKGTGFVKDISSLPQCLTAAGFSTHDAAAVKTALEADDGKLYSVYAALLNKMTVTSSLMSIYKDDAATLLKSLNLSDDTITVTRT